MHRLGRYSGVLVAAVLAGRAVTAAPERLAVLDPRAIEARLELMEGVALSPSGDRAVVSAIAPDGRRHIFVLSEAGAPTQVTSGPGDDWAPRFSFDGASIAFVSNRSGNRDIWVVQASGGEPKQITSDPTDDIDPEWSPDGSRLVFASTRGGPLLLYQVTLADKMVFSLTAGAGRDRRPSWSPDGRWVAFESTRDGKPHVWLIPPEGGEARRLTDRDDQEETWPAWMPNGDTVVTLSGVPRSPGTLWLYPLEVGSTHRRPLPVTPPPGVTGVGAPPPAISRDGRKFAYIGGGRAAIEVLPSRGGGSTAIVEASARLAHPSWSKDGRRLVIAADLKGSWDLWIAGVSTGRLNRLTDDDDRERDPEWALPTGDVVFTREGDDGRTIHILEPETRRVIRFGAGSSPGRASDSQAAWSPDARSIAFVSERGGSKDLYIGPTGGGEPRRLTNYPGSEAHPTWSPDGKWIAFERDQGSGSEIWKIPSAGGEPIQVTQRAAGSAGDTQPAWSPTGSNIAFTRALPGADAGSDLYIVPPEGGKPFPLYRGSGARIAEPAWSPDGEHLACSYSRRDKVFLANVDAPPPPGAPVPGHPGTPEGQPKVQERQEGGEAKQEPQ